jgi:hypothetical protein
LGEVKVLVLAALLAAVAELEQEWEEESSIMEVASLV